MLMLMAMGLCVWWKVSSLPDGGTYLQLVITLVHQPLEMERHAPGKGVQVFRGRLATFQPLQIQNILLVVGHLEWEQPNTHV